MTKKKAISSSTTTVKGTQKDGKKRKSTSSLVVSGKSTESANESAFLCENNELAIGAEIVVKYRDGSARAAKIIERNCNEQIGGSKTWQYYIHYHDFNRRMDEWIKPDRIVSLGVGNAPAMFFDSNNNHNHDSGRGRSSSGSIRDKDTDDFLEEDMPLTIDDDDDVKPGGCGSVITTVAELEHDEHAGLDEASLIEHEEITKVKNVNTVLLGRYFMECWYFSPFPKEYYPSGPVDCLYFCEFTLRFFRTKSELIRYQSKPNLPRHPPGNEIYRDNKLSMFELDGAVEKVYCQNLCYFAKLFLDHKTLYWDVDPFLFYVLCTYDSRGFHPVGFFSKEKYSDMGYNLACILTFPCAQRQGFGRFLISMSYELSKKEEKMGSPEKPLSDLGAVSYKSYWASTLLSVLKHYPGQQLSIVDLTRLTSILPDDILATLQSMGLVEYVSTGESIAESTGDYLLCCDHNLLEELSLKYPTQGNLVDSSKLNWAPLYVTDPKKDKWSLFSLTKEHAESTGSELVGSPLLSGM